ncbi:MAG: hypothetical protein QM775_07555 [Pirellulales bacterium]
MRHAIDDVPAATVDLPRHLRLFADRVEIDVVFPGLLGRRRIKRLSFSVRPGL